MISIELQYKGTQSDTTTFLWPPKTINRVKCFPKTKQINTDWVIIINYVNARYCSTDNSDFVRRNASKLRETGIVY